MRKEIEWFAQQMENKLRLGDEIKSTWKTESIGNLTKCLLVEAEELLEANSLDKIILEAVDVANYAMMVADVARAGLDKTEIRFWDRGMGLESLKHEIKFIIDSHPNDPALCADIIAKSLQPVRYAKHLFELPKSAASDA